MIKKTIKFIHTLKIFFLALIIISSLFVLGINPVDVGRFVGAKIGSAVGMSVSIPENPFNKLALQLEEKEDRLTKKEQELTQREKELQSNNINQNNFVLFLVIGISVLFVLVLLNYYFDYKRRKNNKIIK